MSFDLRVGVDARVVEGALPQPPIVVDQLPGRARIVGQEDAAVGGLDDRVDAVRVGARDRDADLSPDRLRKPGVPRQLVQVAPPSVVLKRPLPGPPLESECGVRKTSHSPA